MGSGLVDSLSGHRVRLVLAFFAIYVLWGSTYLAIRVAVETVPPLFAAGVRFAVAGTVLYVSARIRGAVGPSRPQWRNLTILGALMFLLTYSGLFWAEKSVASGIASVLVASVPLWTALLEMFVFKREPPCWTTLGAVVLGLGGVATLALDPGGGRINLLACLVVAASQIAWSLGTALTTTMTLPRSHLVTSGGQMMAGGAMLHAYVNPVVALLIGHELGGEPIGARTIVGGVLVLASTIALLCRREAAVSTADSWISGGEEAS